MMTGRERRLLADLDESTPSDQELSAVRLITLRSIKEALFRHRGFWVACAALGLFVGGSLHIVLPAKYVGTTTLYLAEPTTGAAYSISDDVSLLDTSAVARRAIGLMHLPRSQAFPGTYTGHPLGNVLLMIKADGPTPTEARNWVRAVTTAFLSVRSRTLNGQTELVISSLQTEIRRLSAQVGHLDSAIRALSVTNAAPATANQEAQLVSERGSDQSQLLNLQTQIQTEKLAESSITKGSYVLDPAVVSLPSAKRIFAEDGLSGLVAGLAIGIGVLIVGGIISDRPRRRAEISALLQSPVLLSVAGPILPRRLPWKLGPRSLKKPGKRLQQVQSIVLSELAQIRTNALAVIATGKDTACHAAPIVARAALTLAISGKRVVVVDLTEQHPLPRLLGARVKEGGVQEVNVGPGLLKVAVGSVGVGDLDPREVIEDADSVLVLADADPAVAVSHLGGWAANGIVVVRAGRASDLLIEATGQMLRAAGIVNIGCVLLDADKGDETFGGDIGRGRLYRFRAEGSGEVDEAKTSGLLSRR